MAAVSGEDLAAIIHFGDQVAQLMHLGTIAFVISAAYVGLDKLGNEQEKFREKLQAACAAVKEWLVPLDLKNAPWETQKQFLTHDVFVLVMVARLPLDLPLHYRAMNCMMRQPKLPLLNFIRDGRDARFMSLLCVLDLAALLVIAAVGMWPQHTYAILASRPVWLPFAMFIVLILTRGFYMFRPGFLRTKWALKYSMFVMAAATVAALVFPQTAYHAVYTIAPQLDIVAYLLFAVTLCYTVFISAASTVLSDVETTLTGYKTAMEEHIRAMRQRLIRGVDTSLDTQTPGGPAAS